MKPLRSHAEHSRLPGLNRRLVMELDRGRARELLLVVALSALMLAPLLLYVWQSVDWFQTGYRIEQLKSRRDHLVEVNHQLRLERTSLESLARVEAIAVGQLGLEQPPSGTVVLVDVTHLRPRPRVPRADLTSTRASIDVKDAKKHDADPFAN